MIPNLPNLRHLRAFEAAARLRSINAAAKAVNLSQPALTHAMGKLEVAFGVSLFSRRRTGVEPSGAGLILQDRAARFLAQVDRALAEAGGASRRAPASDDVARLVTASHLRALVAIAEGGSFSEGARLLGMAEPSVHRAARDIERLVGRELFRRSAGAVEPTRRARELARRVSVALRELEQAAEEIGGLGGPIGGRVRIAALPLVRTLILPRAVNALLASHPAASVEVVEGPYETLISDLRRGAVDVLVGALRQPPPASDVVERILFDEPYAIVGRRGHPLGASGQVELAALGRFEWVVASRGTPLRAAFERLFADSGTEPRARVEASSLTMVRGLLAESDRLTLLSPRQVAVEERAGLIEILPFTLPERSRAIGFATRTDWRPSPIHEAFLALLAEICEREVGAG